MEQKHQFALEITDDLFFYLSKNETPSYIQNEKFLIGKIKEGVNEISK